VIDIRTIPTEIRAAAQWAVRRAKVPYVSGTDRKAKSNDPKTWGSFDAAVAAVEAGTGDGLYYALRTGSGVVGVDLDHCVTDGVIAPWAMVYVRLLNSFTCISASGTGLRILVKGAKTSDRCKKGPVECYDHDRFLSITDQRVPGTPETIEERQAELAAFMQLAFPDPKPEPKPKAEASKPAGDVSADRRFAAAMRDPLFDRLHRGDISGYPSPSEGRMAYWFKAAFYTGGDRALMRTWFEASALDQRKLDRLGDSEMQKAIDGVSAFYDPDSGVDLAEGIAEQQSAVEAAESIIAGGCCGGCACDCCTRQRPQLERAYAASRQHVSAMTTIRKSTALSGKHKSVAEALLLTVEQARRRGKAEALIFYGDRTARKEGRDPGGLARDGGTSPSTVGTLVEELRKHEAASPYRFETIEGENGLPRVVVKFDPNSTMLDDAAAIARLEREKSQHGGSRVACPDHPTAPLIRTTACAECGQIVDSQTLNVDRESAGSKLLQGVAAATARQRDDKVRQFATRAKAPDPDPDALLHDATGSPNGHARANGSTNGHHPPPPPVDPLRATPLEIIELLQSKYGPPPAHNDAGEVGSL
jgi:hypothetical protein